MKSTISYILTIPLKILVFSAGYLFYSMELAANWITGVGNRTEYARMGSCKRCGRCCACLALVVPEMISKRRRLVRAAGLWHKYALNFHFLGKRQDMLVYSCNYFNGETCSIYPFRHRICRFFPRPSLYGHPELDKECGFQFIKREVLNKRTTARQRKLPVFDDMLRQKLE